MDRKTVYIETSVVSYLTARPSGDLLAAAWQKVTVDWWETQRGRFDLFTSNTTVEEAGKGDPVAITRRLDVLAGISKLSTTMVAIALSKELLRQGAIPSVAENDVAHVAVSAVHGIDYLLTWNCHHLDNAEIKPFVREICALHGWKSPEICTPRELMRGIKNG